MKEQGSWRAFLVVGAAGVAITCMVTLAGVIDRSEERVQDATNASRPELGGAVGSWSRRVVVDHELQTTGQLKQHEVTSASAGAVREFTTAAYRAAEAPNGSAEQRDAITAMATATQRFGQLDAKQRDEVAAAWQVFAATELRLD